MFAGYKIGITIAVHIAGIKIIYGKACKQDLSAPWVPHPFAGISEN